MLLPPNALETASVPQDWKRLFLGVHGYFFPRQFAGRDVALHAGGAILLLVRRADSISDGVSSTLA